MKALLGKLAARLEQMPSALLLGWGLLYVLVVGVTDYFTPMGTSFTLFYLLGVAFVGWWAGKWPASAVATLAAAITVLIEWVFLSHVWGHSILAWNQATRWLLLNCCGWLAAKAGALSRQQNRLVEQRTRQWRLEALQHRATAEQLAQMLQRLEEATNNYKMQARVLESMAEAVLVSDQGGLILLTNPALDKLLGYEPGALKGQPLQGLLALPQPEELQRLRNGLEQIRTLGFTQGEFLARRKDGSQLRVELQGSGLRLGERLLMVLVGQDVTQKRLIEETVRRSEARQRAILATAMEGFVLLDRTGHLLEVNQAFCQISGYSPEELVQLSVSDLEASDNPEQIVERLAALEHQAQRFQTYHKRKDGQLISVEVSAAFPCPDKEWLCCFVRDITAQKLAEQTLNLSQRRLAEAMDLAQLANWEYDVASDLYTFDDRFYALYGTSAQREGGKHLSAETYAREFLFPEDAHLVCESIALLKAGSDATPHFQVEHRIRRRDGETRYLVVRAAASRDEAGRLLKLYGANQDITERKRAEANLAEALQLNRTLIDASTVGIAAYRASGQCVSVNPAMERITGGSLEHLLKHNFFQLESWRSSGLLANARAALSSQQPRQFEIDTVSSFGQRLQVSVQMAPFVNRGELHLLLMITDITDQRRSELLLQVQRDVASSLSLTTQLGPALQRLVEIAAQLEGVDCGAAYLLEEASGALCLAAHQGLGQALTKGLGQLSSELAQSDLLGQGQGRFLSASQWPSPLAEAWLAEGLRAVAWLPLRHEGRLLGALQLGSHSRQQLPPTTQRLLEAMATQAAGALARMRAESALQQSEARLRTLINSAPVVLFAGNRQGTVTFEDGQALRLLGISPGANVGRPTAQLYKDHPGLLQNVHRVLRGEEFSTMVEIGAFAFDCRYVPIRSPDGQVDGYLGVATNITEQQRLEKQILEISDREQARIGQDIHDGLCQQLVSLAFDANSLQRQLSAQQRPESALAQRLADVLDESITEARQLSRGLFPVRLDGDGLVSALEELARATAGRFGLDCRLSTNGPVLLPSKVAATHLYRIAQEAITNAIKHGQPRLIQLQLQAEPLLLRLQIDNDGLPFSCQPARRPAGLGLHIMDYRARSLGGSLSVGPAARGGTTVCCCMPWPKP